MWSQRPTLALDEQITMKSNLFYELVSSNQFMLISPLYHTMCNKPPYM